MCASTGALLKAVCVCSGLVSLSSQQTLAEQLLQRWGGGVELHSWSLLPTGSGLGEKTTRTSTHNTKLILNAVIVAFYNNNGSKINMTGVRLPKITCIVQAIATSNNTAGVSTTPQIQMLIARFFCFFFLFRYQ